MRHAPRFLLLLLLPPPRPPRAHTALGRKARRTQHSHSPLPRPSTHAQPTRTPSPSSSSPPPSVAQHDVVRQARKASQAPLRHRHRPAAQCLRQVPHSERLCHECVACPRSLLLFPSAPAHSLPFPLAVYRAHQWTQGYDVKSAADGSSSYRLTCATHRSVPLLPLLPSRRPEPRADAVSPPAATAPSRSAPSSPPSPSRTAPTSPATRASASRPPTSSPRTTTTRPTSRSTSRPRTTASRSSTRTTRPSTTRSSSPSARRRSSPSRRAWTCASRSRARERRTSSGCAR